MSAIAGGRTSRSGTPAVWSGSATLDATSCARMWSPVAPPCGPNSAASAGPEGAVVAKGNDASGDEQEVNLKK